MPILKNQRFHNEQQFLPDFCTLKLVFSVLVIGELFAIIITLSSTGFNTKSWDTLALSSIYIQWNGLLSLIFLCALRKYLSSYNRYIIASLSYIGLLILFLLISEVTYSLVHYLHLQPLLLSTDRLTFHIYNIVIGGIISGIALRYFYILHQWKLKTEAEAQSRLQLLQARIRPHFLFNSMNTIASLTRTNPELAEQVTIDLADLFRFLFQENQPLVSWAKELQIAKQYLQIESLRIAERLRIHLSVDSVPDNEKLPVLTLQTVLENAIYHGIEPSIDGGNITITAQCQSSQIEINIINSHTTRQKTRMGNQMALKNIHQRLGAHFGDNAGIVVKDNNNEFTVKIFFPYVL